MAINWGGIGDIGDAFIRAYDGAQKDKRDAAWDKVATDFVAGGGGGEAAATPGVAAAPVAAASGGSAAPFKTSDPVAPGLAPHQMALLNAIAGGESAGKYNIRYTPGGGATFADLSRHPAIYERGPEGPSSAAGRYQFVKRTWDGLGGGDFSPENQDRRALQLATQDYRQRTGRDLDTDLQAGGLTPQIVQALAPTWAAFKGNVGRHLATYNDSLGRYAKGGTATRTASADPRADAPDAGARPVGFDAMGNSDGMEDMGGGFLVPPAPQPASPAAPTLAALGQATVAGPAAPAAPAKPAIGFLPPDPAPAPARPDPNRPGAPTLDMLGRLTAGGQEPIRVPYPAGGDPMADPAARPETVKDIGAVLAAREAERASVLPPARPAGIDDQPVSPAAPARREPAARSAAPTTPARAPAARQVATAAPAPVMPDLSNRDDAGVRDFTAMAAGRGDPRADLPAPNAREAAAYFAVPRPGQLPEMVAAPAAPAAPAASAPAAAPRLGSVAIPMAEAQALRDGGDSADARAAFDSRFGAGASARVFGRRDPIIVPADPNVVVDRRPAYERPLPGEPNGGQIRGAAPSAPAVTPAPAAAAPASTDPEVKIDGYDGTWTRAKVAAAAAKDPSRDGIPEDAEMASAQKGIGPATTGSTAAAPASPSAASPGAPAPAAIPSAIKPGAPLPPAVRAADNTQVRALIGAMIRDPSTRAAGMQAMLNLQTKQTASAPFEHKGALMQYGNDGTLRVVIPAKDSADEGTKITAQQEARMKAAPQLGLEPGTDSFRKYVIEGKYEAAADPNGPMFDGKSVEGQGLNRLVATGQLTRDQAALFAAGKTITNPADGSIMFMTPEAIFRRPADGGPATPVAPIAAPPTPAAPASSGSAQPAPATPGTASADAARPGMIPLTQSKAEKTPTEGQANAALYSRRMELANDVLSKPEITRASMSRAESVIGGLPLVGNNLVSSEYQQAEQAQRDFINATLRRESGAAISESEFGNARKQYFPQPGDGIAVLTQKATNRRTAIEGIKAAAGSAYKTLTGATAPVGVPDGATATNPKTGARMINRGGQWTPMQ